jgi:ABC-type antimicrobial peptide transport system permease subunit
VVPCERDREAGCGIGLRPPSRRPGNFLWIAAPALAAIAALALLVLPSGQMTSVTATSDSSQTVTESRRTKLLETEGSSVIPLVMAPVVVAGIPLLVPRPRRRRVAMASAALLWVFVVLGLASIGLYFVPAAAVLTAAVVRERGR